MRKGLAPGCEVALFSERVREVSSKAVALMSWACVLQLTVREPLPEGTEAMVPIRARWRACFPSTSGPAVGHELMRREAAQRRGKAMKTTAQVRRRQSSNSGTEYPFNPGQPT